jgi:hypothetical protein
MSIRFERTAPTPAAIFNASVDKDKYQTINPNKKKSTQSLEAADDSWHCGISKNNVSITTQPSKQYDLANKKSKAFCRERIILKYTPIPITPASEHLAEFCGGTGKRQR